MEHPLFTIIMTTYNRRDLLPRAIQSVLNQTCKDFELFVIDNGSTDDTRFVVQGIKDARIKYILNPQPTRSCEAPRNLGIKLAKGSFIGFLDDDDMWYPERLEKVRRAFEIDHDISVVCHNLNRRVNGKINGIWKAGPRTENIYEVLLYERNCLTPDVTTIRTDLLRELGGFDLNSDFEAAADWDLWLRMASKKVKIHFIDEVLGEYSRTGTNWSEVDPAFGAKIAFLIRGHILNYEKKPIFRISKRGTWRLFQLYLIAGRFLMRGGHYRKALKFYLNAMLFIIIKPALLFNLYTKVKNDKFKEE